MEPPQVCTADLVSGTSRRMPGTISAGRHRAGGGERPRCHTASRRTAAEPCTAEGPGARGPCLGWGPGARGPRRGTLLPVTTLAWTRRAAALHRGGKRNRGRPR